MAHPEIVVVHSRSGESSAVAARLQSGPFEVTVVPVGRSMIDIVQQHQPDVIVIEHGDGEFDLVRVCRDLGSSMNSWVMVVSGDREDPDDTAIRLLDAGADILLPRDASSGLLRAYVRVGLRDRPAPYPVPEQIQIGDVVVDLNAHAAFVGGEPVRCPPRQFLLLAALARHPNIVIEHGALMTSVWGAQPDVVDPRRLRIAVSLLRGVLGTGPSRPRIETVPHVGYRLVVNSARPAA